MEGTTTTPATTGNPQGSFPGNRTVGQPTTSCPLVPSIQGRFETPRVKCGSRANLQAEATNIDDGTQTNFALRKLPLHIGVADESAPLRGHQIRGLAWVSQKPSSLGWNGEIDFEVSADDVSADSSNRLRIHDYPNVARETRSAHMTSGIYGWDKKYDIAFTDGEVRITIKIKLLNMEGPRPAEGQPEPPQGSAVSGIRKWLMARSIRGYLTEKWAFHRAQCERHGNCDCPLRRKCCKFRVKFDVQFVESGQHHIVRLYEGPGRANAAEWFREPTRDNTYAHETGHLLGFYDEYAGGATGPAPWQVHAGYVMSAGGGVPDYYYGDFKDWFTSKMGENWDYMQP